MKSPSKRQLAAHRRSKVAERAAAVPDTDYTNGTVERDDAGRILGLTPLGLSAVETLARDGGTQNYIAARLGLSRSQFKTLLGRANDDSRTDAARIAWERGQAQHEQDVIARLLQAGTTYTPSLMFYAKAKLGFRENDPIQVDNSSRLVITLPAPMTAEQWRAAAGEPIDCRVKTVEAIEPAPMPALPPPDDDRAARQAAYDERQRASLKEFLSHPNH